METKRLTAADFPGGVYKGSIEFDGHIEIDGGLGSVRIEGGISAKGAISVSAGTSITAGGSIEAGTSIEAGESITAGWSIKAGTSIEAGESITAGGSIEAGESIEAGTSIKAGTSILSLRFEITCKSLATHLVPFWRSFYAAMPPLRRWAAELLNDRNCYESLKSKVTRNEAESIVVWDGWHPIIRAQLKMFFGLVKQVDGSELIVTAESLPPVDVEAAPAKSAPKKRTRRVTAKATKNRKPAKARA